MGVFRAAEVTGFALSGLARSEARGTRALSVPVPVPRPSRLELQISQEGSGVKVVSRG